MIRLTPTSSTAAPGLTMSFVMIPGTPAAATTMSAARTSAARSRVPVWQETVVAFSLRRAKMGKAERAAKVDEVLAQFSLAGHAEHPCHLLSGGQKQLLALAAVLVTDPDILVADEPTTLLDLRNARRFAEILRGLPQQSVVVTHSLELVADFDRVLVVDEGKVVADDSPAPAIEFYRRLIG